jgi:hypothetical protein
MQFTRRSEGFSFNCSQGGHVDHEHGAKMLAAEIGPDHEGAGRVAEAPGKGSQRVLEAAKARGAVHRDCADCDCRLGDAATQQRLSERSAAPQAVPPVCFATC